MIFWKIDIKTYQIIIFKIIHRILIRIKKITNSDIKKIKQKITNNNHNNRIVSNLCKNNFNIITK